MSEGDDPMPPPSPALAGTVSLVLAAFALLAVGLVLVQLDDLSVRAAKKGLLVAVPLSLVAALLGMAGRQNWRGKLGLFISTVLLLGVSVLFAWVSFA